MHVLILTVTQATLSENSIVINLCLDRSSRICYTACFVWPTVYHELLLIVQKSWRGRTTRCGGLGSNEETRTSKHPNPGPNDLQQVPAKGHGHESIDYRLSIIGQGTMLDVF
jgi:hypothetical protein